MYKKVTSFLYQNWVKITIFCTSALLTLFYFIFPPSVCGLPFLITSAIILGLALLFYYREHEAEIMRLLCSFCLSIFGIASFSICIGFINRTSDLPMVVKAIEIITLVIGTFGFGKFINTVYALIQEKKRCSHTDNAHISIATIIPAVVTAIGFATAIINWSTAFFKARS